MTRAQVAAFISPTRSRAAHVRAGSPPLESTYMPKRTSQPQMIKPADCTIGIHGGDGALCIRTTRRENRQLKPFPVNVNVTAKSNVPDDNCFGLGHTMDFPVPAGTYAVTAAAPANCRGLASVTYEGVVVAGRYTVVQIEIFEDFNIERASAAKKVGRLKTRSSVGIAIAGSADRNQEIADEADALLRIQQGGVRTVPVENTGLIVELVGVATPLSAYHMKWLTGLHSKTEKGDFHQALNALVDEPAKQEVALTDLLALERFVTTVANIKDLQLMLEPSTGRLHVIDPGGLSAPSDEQVWIAKWRKLALGEEKAAPVRGGKSD